MGENGVIIIGAGIAGLSAAYELALAGVSSTVLEARDRMGGRIHTSPGMDTPVELGAEFVHGKDPELWNLIDCAHAGTEEVPEHHRVCRESKLIEMNSFWEDFESIVERVDSEEHDESFADFLAQLRDVPPYRKQMAIDFVEGFEAADAKRISIHSIAAEEERSEQIEGDHSFRIAAGYGALIEWLAHELESRNVRIHCGVKVEEVDWERQSVTITARNDHGTQIFEASQALITLPLGVLKTGDVRFDPELTDKRRAIEGLEMGQVIKVILQFESRFWSAENFGFIHGCDEWFPTWWSHEHAAMLTGWAGGPRADRMIGKGREFVIARAVEAVGRIFKMPQQSVKKEVVAAYYYDWSADPFSRGAYSYVPVGMMEEQRKLAEPVEETLFFAGEAATLDSQPGTVHGALKSGKHAAQALLRCRNEAHQFAHS